MKSDIEKVIDVIRSAGGEIRGRTRLQKISCLLELACVGAGFCFIYHHFGPYCEELALAADAAQMMKKIKEEKKRANWGGIYSVYSLNEPNPPHLEDSVREQLARFAAKADPIDLELAVTAAYFAVKSIDNPWNEVAACKSEKAKNGNLDKAKEFYQELRSIADNLPNI